MAVLRNVQMSVLILTVVFQCCYGFKRYSSCRQIMEDQGSNAWDGEYILYTKNKIGVPIYCRGTQEYITLPYPWNNYARFPGYLGDPQRCTSRWYLNPPGKQYEGLGETKFSKIAIEFQTMTVKIDDFTFTSSTSGQKRYGTAGDKHTSGPECEPIGRFYVYLDGTPFAPVKETRWMSTGTYLRGNATQLRSIINNHTYRGCFKENQQKLTTMKLPGSRYDSKTNNTVDNCRLHCLNNNFRFAGLKYDQCHCDDVIHRLSRGWAVDDIYCNISCSGDSNWKCGGTGYIQVYRTEVPQTFKGKCGGYPGQCFPTTLENRTIPRLQLDVLNGQHICSRKNPCINDGGCIALSGATYKCQCNDDYIGKNCDIFNDLEIVNGSSCDAGFQVEGCGCQEKFCRGAWMEGDTCISSTGNAAVTCRPGSPGHVILFNTDGMPTASCPDGAEITGCTFLGRFERSVIDLSQGKRFDYDFTHGHGVIMDGVCTACPKCKVQARCKQYICGCKNGGTCNKVTGQCDCPTAYYGSKCETFDYCTHYQNASKDKPLCNNGGSCTVVHKAVVTAYAGDMAGDRCIFPFDYKNNTYNTCVDDNSVGPPFACAGDFDGSESYIDLGQWSPGFKYTIAAWVRPYLIDHKRMTVVGGVMSCNDFGISLNSGTFRGYVRLSKECASTFDAKEPVSVGKWYMVAVTSNGSHILIFQNGEQMEDTTMLLNNLPTTEGFRIGGESCCSYNKFRGMIKTVKVWNRDMTREDINASMYAIGTANSTNEALYGGLVGHWELGDITLPVCGGPGVEDHGMDDWVLEDEQIINGIHCNISKFIVPKGVSVKVLPYNGNYGGRLDVTAQTIKIYGYMDASGAGYRGGPSSYKPGEFGRHGESYIGNGTRKLTANRGGGGGGMGANGRSDGMGRSGGGGGYSFPGSPGYIEKKDKSGLGRGGIAYGDAELSIMYLGSGGGSGGNAKDLKTNPTGGKGGNGGGSIKLLAATSITISGIISVAGDNGQGDFSMAASCLTCPNSCEINSDGRCLGNSTTSCYDMSGPGGGGSGGSIYLSAQFVNIGDKNLWAHGGKGGYGAAHCCGGDGSMGRIRIDSVALRGTVGDTEGELKTTKLQNTFVDHSQIGQKQIDYRTTVYGNEVYLGCFKEVSVTNRKLAVTIPFTLTTRDNLTPVYCMKMCRQKGYMYSGTQNGNACFCDNHLDRSNKIQDSACDLPCSGDPLFKCGGKSKLQIFGPPPGTPALGYNVTRKCQPWCATADADTGTPKTGLCYNSPPTITDWDFTCQCPLGKMGDNCDQDCPIWKYGVSCRRNCSCITNNTASCDPQNGACFCKPGYTEKQCRDICKSDSFGQDCSTACNCSQNSQCDPFTGVCSCNPGWSGAYCNYPCPSHKYGSGCNQICNCYHGSCEPRYGTCQCQAGYKKPKCLEHCDQRTYGQNCESPCDCNGQLCDAVTGFCQCGPGYLGPKCNILCPYGTWGQNCLKKCLCVNGFGCDHMTGVCQCGPGFKGDICQTICSQETFGINCYGSCSCVFNHTSSCNNKDGECTCLPGYYGYNCELRCDHGYYGDRCSKQCTCVNGGKCNPVDGSCSCPPGFQGSRCENPCSQGRYGDKCQSVCPSSCHGECNIVDGSCKCKDGQGCRCPPNTAGWKTKCNQTCGCTNGHCRIYDIKCNCHNGWNGTKCDQPCAKKGTYGYDCNRACRCVNGRCATETGYCWCNKGFMGRRCDQPCKTGNYGTNCNRKCPTCGQYSLPGCDVITGSCVCGEGYTGFFCDRPCSQGSYGHNCTKTCSCRASDLCDSVTGKCICKPGYTGDLCQNKCPHGTWGQHCSENCNCGPHGNSCSAEDGKCLCNPGYTGDKCQASCPVNTFGVNCSSTCNCNLAASTCSPIDGECWCLAGWTGTNCDIGCRKGNWGRTCSQVCQCNNRGNCDPVNGKCDCDGGYRGETCESQCDQDIYWGKNCASLCACNGAHCDHRTGLCRCPPGKTGKHCEKTCKFNHFGFLCVQQCGCQNNGMCDPVTGQCKCQAGWSGKFCTETCSDDYYGIECRQVCPDCQNGGSCDSFTGKCSCAPNYTGQYCNTTLVIKHVPETQAQTSVKTTTAFNFSQQQFVGLIVGLVFLVIIVALVTVLVSRKVLVGTIGRNSAAVKFKGDEVDLGQDDSQYDTEASTSSATGIVNPVHEDMFSNVDIHGQTEGSTATGGMVSSMDKSRKGN